MSPQGCAWPDGRGGEGKRGEGAALAAPRRNPSECTCFSSADLDRVPERLFYSPFIFVW